MRVVCDNCGASYKIPESKLTKEVNKATCRKCGHAILIRRVVAAPRAAAPDPAVTGPDERTQITSAAELERQGRARTAGAEAAPADNRAVMDAGEETVPRDDGAPPARPAGASTDPGGAGAVARPASVSASPRSASPPPKAPARPAAPVADPAVSAPVPRPPPPPIRAVPSAPIGRPPTIPPPVSAVPPEQKPAQGADIGLTVGGVFVGVVGAVLLLAGTALSISPLGYLGIFLLLFGLIFVVIMLVTGSFGQKPSSKLGAAAGGLFIGALGALAWMLVQLQVAPPEAVAENKPAEVVTTKVVTPPVEATPAPAEAVTPPPAEVAPPVEVPAVADAAPPTPAKELTPEEKAKAEAKAKADAEAKAEAKAKAEEEAKAKAEAKAAAKAQADAEKAAAAAAAPERISSTKTTSTASSTTTKPTTTTPTSSGAGLSVQAVATMVNSNKGVKLCYLKEANLSGAVPRAKVKITIQPSGKPTRAVAVGEYAGTDFGNCIGGAIMGITFPPFDGEPSTITYAN